MNIEQRLNATGGRPSGFDYARLILAIAVVVAHSIDTSYGEVFAKETWATFLGPLFRSLLPLFFALSGFLVAGSLERSRTVGAFVGLRVIRIYPALMVEVLLSALILGPIMTSLPAGAYFTSPVFWSYMWNIIGHVHFFLPGVFNGNPFPPLVNAQLWTVPYELLCYVTLAGLAIIGGLRKRIIVLVGSIALMVAGLVVQLARHGVDLPNYPTAIPGEFLVFAFLAGVCIYLYRERIPYSVAWFWAALAIMLGCLWQVQLGVFFVAFPAAYVVAYLGLTNVKRIALLRGADYSYGIFLYHFAIQQTLMALFPWAREWYWNLALTLPLVAAFAALSWHAVEKPALNLRRPLKRLEDYVISRRERRALRAAD